MYSLVSKNLGTYSILARSFTTSSVRCSRWGDLVNKTKEQHGIQEITVDELHAQLDGQTLNPILIDVREADEWKGGKVPNAICLPRGIMELKVEKVVSPDSDQQIVLYCAGGLRSVMTAASLIGMGYKKENIKSLNGGFGAWKKKGYTVNHHDD